MFKGLRSLIYPTQDLEKDKVFWKKVLDTDPYFDQPFYVGFNVGGYELGLDPNGTQEGTTQPVAYWGVDNIAVAAEELSAKGVTQRGTITDVGDGIKMAVFLDTNQNAFGIIENPHFK